MEQQKHYTATKINDNIHSEHVDIVACDLNSMIYRILLLIQLMSIQSLLVNILHTIRSISLSFSVFIFKQYILYI